MTDDEIMKSLKEADKALKKYKKIVQPVAEELARRKSLFVFGVEGAYSGDLGCWESGSDYICLHIRDDFRAKSEELPWDKPHAFTGEWLDKIRAAKIENIYLGGHF